MLKNENIICISTIDWDFLWQQHQSIMSVLAENNNRILFIENTGVRAFQIGDIPRLKKRFITWMKTVRGFREERINLYIFSPLILPFPYLKLARIINRYLLIRAVNRWMRIMDFYNPIIWSFLPTPIVLDMIDSVPHKLFIYYCTDNFAATSKAARKVVKYEKRVLLKADIVFVMAKNMLEYCRGYNKEVSCVPMGVDANVFLRTSDVQDKPVELIGLENRIVGYVGGIRNSIDQALVKYLAKQSPDFTFVFIGPIQTNISQLSSLKNVIFFGKKEHGILPKYIKHFDVCIIPYKKDEYTNNISPAKLNEYLVLGKPVVSTDLNEIKSFNEDNNVIYIAETYQDFSRFIQEAIKENNQKLINRRKEIALSNSWDRKIEYMSSVIENSLKAKENQQLKWRQRLKSAYLNMRRKVISIALVSMLLLTIIFYTPIVWFLASPLLIFQPPQKADAIVALAGGVGESGKAGQGYEERVEYAVELYKNDFAGNIIFSSGYKYIFEEPLLMKALAVSLGVPQEVIVLEDKAVNTYENVKYVKEILKRRKWQKILLVSSPYHMRRLMLVARKCMPEIKVFYTPIINSRFYSRGGISNRIRTSKQITWQQISAIVHEYLGILYYKLKGFV